MTLQFGKHRGKPYEEVAAADPGYCAWVLKIPAPQGAMLEFQQFLQNRQGGGGGGGAGGGGGGDFAASQNGPTTAPFPPLPNVNRPYGQAFPATPQAAPHPLSQGAPVGASQSAGSQQTAAVLDNQTIMVLELKSKDQFELRAERYDPDSRTILGGSAFLPKAVWSEIMSWPGREWMSDRKCWVFPVSAYEEIVEKLEQRRWLTDPIPHFALSAVLPETPSSLSPSRKSTVAKTPSPQKRKKSATSPASGRSDNSFEGLLENDLQLPAILMPYQREGVMFGLQKANGRVLIGDEMGLGKTLQALVLASKYQDCWPALVVCPSSLRFVWKEQAEKWLPELCDKDRVQVITKGKMDLQSDAAIWVISYNLLADSRTGNKFARRPSGEPHQIVICDESHNIKDWKAQRTKVVVNILQNAQRVVLLSGTPTRNSPDELHPQLCGLQLPGLLSVHQFRRRYCVERQNRIGTGQIISRVVGARNARELNVVLTSSVMIRRLKKDVLHELPDKRRQRVPIEPANTKLVTEVRKAMANKMDDAISMPTLFKKIAEAKLADVKEYVLEVLDRGDEKFIVFAHHHEMLNGIESALQRKLSQDGLSYIRIDGSTAPEKRLPLVNQFQEQEKCRVALLSITACCEGLTLTAAGLVIFAELYWVPGTVEQAEARAHRIGTQHTKVVVEFLVVPGSPDDRIFSELERKKRDTASVLDNVETTFEADTLERRSLKRTLEDEEDTPWAPRSSPKKAGRAARNKASPKMSPASKKKAKQQSFEQLFQQNAASSSSGGGGGGGELPSSSSSSSSAARASLGGGGGAAAPKQQSLSSILQRQAARRTSRGDADDGGGGPPAELGGFDAERGGN
eukprot:CAMPEP_0206556560 /NCGR_PEP_ID=MMETSP0325_2-20121206/18523_1 /ASSEMBLY_ACC=CAM_ASM_000347 /TAXON_ID=2866 /ORGANISM="Crypthecodinium cohnii, Strain Seligo" /LENGTH=853 /DNA_ID=CAMNT_0054057197 /DNA_START=438 /DNA_END=2999 /DNA_ORIENTATION=-